MRVALIAAWLLALAGMDAGLLHGQESRIGFGIRIVPGVAFQQGTFGDDDPETHGELGFSVGAQLRVPLSAATPLVLDGAVMLNRLENPHGGEEVRAVYMLLGPQVGSAPYFRPSAGIALLNWSGPVSSNGLEVQPVLGIALGSERLGGRGLPLSPEFLLRVGGVPGGGYLFWALGLQVAIG